MNKFEQLIKQSPDFFALNYVYGKGLMHTDHDGTYTALAVRLAKQVFDAQQVEINNLKNQLNNMESCYIEKKKALENESYKLNRLG